jgi:hypothetical protein
MLYSKTRKDGFEGEGRHFPASCSAQLAAPLVVEQRKLHELFSAVDRHRDRFEAVNRGKGRFVVGSDELVRSEAMMAKIICLSASMAVAIFWLAAACSRVAIASSPIRAGVTLKSALRESRSSSLRRGTFCKSWSRDMVCTPG